MENEKKRNKVLEIILIILVSLSFVLIPLLNQYRQKIISQNNSELVKRQANGLGSDLIGKNGNVSISIASSDVYTFYTNVGFFDLDLSDNAYQSLINGGSISGSNDDFGFNCTNYFRFVYNQEYTNALSTEYTKIYNLVYYIELDNSNSRSITLGYWDIWRDTNGTHFSSIDDIDFDSVGIIPFYTILNVSYYNYDRLFDGLLTYLGSLSHTYLVANINYQISNNIFASHSLQRTRFVNIDKDLITPLVDLASSNGYSDGYKVGYSKGIEDANGTSVFGVLQRASASISSFLSIEILPNLSMWLLLSIPFSISIMVILLRLLRGGS